MLANLTEIRTSVRYLLNETSEGFFKNVFIDLMINEGQEEFTSETQCLSSSYSHPLEDGDIKNEREIRLSDDFIAFDEGGVIYDGKRLIPTTMKELDAWAGSDWRDETGTPTHFYQRGDMIGFAPGRPVVGITVKYYAVERSKTLATTEVTLSGDYRVIAFRRYVRDYAISMCWEAKNETQKAMVKMASFERGVRKCNNVVFGNKTEPFKMVPAFRRGGQGSTNIDPLRL